MAERYVEECRGTTSRIPLTAGVKMHLNLYQSNRLDRLIAGVWSRGTHDPGFPAIWLFKDACLAVDVLSKHYGMPAAEFWSHVLEGSEMHDVETGWSQGDNPVKADRETIFRL